MNTAISSTSLGGWQKRIFWANFLGLTFEAYDLTIYSLLVLPISQYFHVPAWYSFMVLALTYVARGVGGLFFGNIGDTMGRRSALIVTVVGYSLTTGLTGLSWSLASLIVFRVISGLFIGGEYVALSFTMEAVPKERRGGFSGFLMASYSTGFLLASASFGLVNILSGSHFAGSGWRWPFFVGILPALIALWLRLGIQESEIWTKIAKRSTERKKIPFLEIFKKRYIGRTIHAWLVMAALIWAYDVLILAYPTMVTYMKFPRTSVATLAIILNVGSLLGAVSGGHLSQVLGRRRGIILMAVLGIVATPFIAPFWMLPGIPSYAYIAVFGFLGAMFAEGGFGIVPAYLSERYPTEVRATGATGTYNLGQIIAGWSTMLLAKQFGSAVGSFTRGMTIYAVVAFVILIALVYFGPETKDVDLEHDEQ